MLAAISAELPAIEADAGRRAELARRVDLGLARAGGEHATHAAARVLAGPLAARLDAQLSAANFGGARELGGPAGLSAALGGRLASDAVAGALAELSGPATGESASAAPTASPAGTPASNS